MPFDAIGIASVNQYYRSGIAGLPLAQVKSQPISQELYALKVDARALYDNAGTAPVLLDWSEKP